MVLNGGARTRPGWPTFDHERGLWDSGHRLVAGADEVGRGAWAGPVSVGVAVVEVGRPGSYPEGLRDSKLLSERRRESMFEDVAGWCTDWAVGHAGPEECDQRGMTAAIRLAAMRAWAQLRPVPDAVLVDGPRDLFGWTSGEEPCQVAGGPTVVPVVGGDARCVSVAAASVLAKVVRDRIMREQAAHFPPYDFEQNKGYPSPSHRRALNGFGLSAIHRRSWSYVKELPWG